MHCCHDDECDVWYRETDPIVVEAPMVGRAFFELTIGAMILPASGASLPR
jgi:hypothetical protein